ncbi:heptaprenyl diphosphate synthase component II [Listeria fleischmannii]|uniref:Heptaprenyl diphosphate synthase component II n=1 Tax=Listeria fleischmannii TaxID=1069827 RepID=A0A841YDA7_9LIST|nr:heptaprenyl diphosphate synthase component II [Listeria fleischmannii]EIA20908.1 heptaprenyl diphosphate synthase component II [Listeria fleischmannii subsp. coloradonensis]MBC1398214.1 heptaprenyl diphosphate synthase component II [Listeria fleischmannii]MBC1426275.1 heptaprenyl diphosphate synthase component II [Listeria fleischmannii]STY35543.1 Heptaprenyl diphosphate synthase component 2 [Listeria fleischmannii subsp. coloradonensis]
MKFNFLYPVVQKDIEAIEVELKQAVSNADAETTSASALHLLEAGGKRIRPMFVCLTARLGKPKDFSLVRDAAVAIELIHMASIVHDDVVDDAELRRGRQTIKAIWGNHIAMYTGDFLFAKSLEYMTKIDNIKAHQMLSAVTVELAVGEIEQIKDKFNFNQSVRSYLRRIKRKTALLIAASSGLGGILADLPDKMDDQLYLFGYYVGMAFQITDDILDFMGTERVLGKPAGEDLRQGNITLPVFFAMRDPLLKKRISRVTEDSTDEEINHLVDAIKASGAIEASEQVATAYLKKAMAILDSFPTSKEIKPLKQIVKMLDKREY